MMVDSHYFNRQNGDSALSIGPSHVQSSSGIFQDELRRWCWKYGVEIDERNDGIEGDIAMRHAHLCETLSAFYYCGIFGSQGMLRNPGLCYVTASRLTKNLRRTARIVLQLLIRDEHLHRYTTGPSSVALRAPSLMHVKVKRLLTLNKTYMPYGKNIGVICRCPHMRQERVSFRLERKALCLDRN
jgi:hypothetical protein